MRCSGLRAAGREHVPQMLEIPLRRRGGSAGTLSAVVPVSVSERIVTVFIHHPILYRVFGLNVRFARTAVRCNVMRCNVRCMRGVLVALRKEGQ